MLAANEAVASHLEQAGVASIYRIHEPPDPQSVVRLFAKLAALEVPTPPIPAAP